MALQNNIKIFVVSTYFLNKYYFMCKLNHTFNSYTNYTKKYSNI